MLPWTLDRISCWKGDEVAQAFETWHKDTTFFQIDICKSKGLNQDDVFRDKLESGKDEL